MRSPLRGVAVAAALTSACGTGAEVTGDIAGSTLAPRTVFAWLDATDLDEDDGRVVAATRERKAMHVVLSGAAFDPEEDIRFLPATALVDRALAERGGGRLEFRITDYDAVATGAALSSRREELLDDAPFLDDVDLSLGERPLAPDAVYPAETIAPASALTVELTLREAGRARGEAVAGTLVVRLDRAERDRQDAPTGELRIELDAAVIGEAIAECNASGGRASVCEPARP